MDCDSCEYSSVRMNEEPCKSCIGSTARTGAQYTNWRPATREEKISNPGTYVIHNESALDVQVAGDHYKGKGIQPVEYISANNLTFLEGCIVKRITRWRDKQSGDKFDDLNKIKHEVDLLIEMEKKYGG